MDQILLEKGEAKVVKPGGSSAPVFLMMLILLAAVAIIGLQIFIVLSVKQTHDLVDQITNEPGRPVNLEVSKKSVIAYYSSGLYDDDLSKLTSQWFTTFKLAAPGPNDTVIFDVDDTVLSNYEEMQRSDFGYIPKFWDEWVLSENATAIPQTRQFYQSLLAEGYKVIFLTGRRDLMYNATAANLEKQGFYEYEMIITRDPHEYALTAYDFKSRRRAALAKQGWNIVGSIGDQLSDIDGNFAGLRMKVPNYCYFVA